MNKGHGRNNCVEELGCYLLPPVSAPQQEAPHSLSTSGCFSRVSSASHSVLLTVSVPALNRFKLTAARFSELNSEYGSCFSCR